MFKTNWRTKKVGIIIMSSLTVLAVVLLIDFTNNRTQGYEDTISVDVAVSIQKERGDMLCQPNRNVTYIMLYSETKYNKAKGIDKSMTEIEEGLVRSEALCWYADNHGLKPSDKDIEKYIDQLVSDIKASEEYDEYEAAAEAHGTTYEEILRNDLETYRITQTVENVYQSVMKQYQQDGKLSTAEQEEKDEMMQAAWNDFVKKTIEEYKSSSDYSVLKREFREAEKKLQ